MPRASWAKDEGRWRKTSPPEREATEAIQHAHCKVLVAFTPNQVAGAARRDERLAAVQRMNAACDAWLDATNAQLSDTELLRRAITATTGPKRRRRFAYVADRFGIGSTLAADLCRRFDCDPDEEVGGAR